MDDHDELRSQLVAALMTAEDFSFEQAERVVAEFEKTWTCPRCGAEVTDGFQVKNQLTAPQP